VGEKVEGTEVNLWVGLVELGVAGRVPATAEQRRRRCCAGSGELRRSWVGEVGLVSFTGARRS